MSTALRKTEELHHHRWSAPEIRYFVTVCTAGHRSGLVATQVREAILGSVERSNSLQDPATIAFMVMPDHVHWLFRLGKRLSLGRIVGRFKVETGGALGDADLRWQRDFFEHRLRPQESVEDYGRYIFLNPYRAGLLELDAKWPGWFCPKPERMVFLAHFYPDGSVPREWLQMEDGDGEDEIQAGGD